MSQQATRDRCCCSGAIFSDCHGISLKLELCRHDEVATMQETCRFGMNAQEDLILAHKP